MGSLRLQLEGSRWVVMANISDMMRFLQEEAEPLVPDPSIKDISNALKHAKEKTISALRARGANLWHGFVTPKDLLYMPPGYWIIEINKKEERNFGLRTSVLPQCEEGSPSLLGFEALMQLKGHIPETVTYYRALHKTMALKAPKVKPVSSKVVSESKAIHDGALSGTPAQLVASTSAFTFGLRWSVDLLISKYGLLSVFFCAGTCPSTDITHHSVGVCYWSFSFETF